MKWKRGTVALAAASLSALAASLLAGNRTYASGVGAPAAMLASLASIPSTRLSAWATPLVTDPHRKPPGAGMRLIVSNIYEGNPNAHGSLEELARWEPDVVALIEAEAEGTDIAVRALFPIEEYSSRVYVRTGEGNPHFVVLSKHHLSDIEATFPDDVGGMPIVEWRQRLGVESAPVRFLLVHPPAPTTPRSTRQWLNYLCAIEENALRDDEPLVVLGDFNATMGHAPFRRLVSKMAGTDVFAGRGTWPQRWIELGLSPFPGMSKLPVPNYLLGLDHVITRGVPLARGWAIPTVGSDHASLLVDFPHYARLVD